MHDLGRLDVVRQQRLAGDDEVRVRGREVAEPDGAEGETPAGLGDLAATLLRLEEPRRFQERALGRDVVPLSDERVAEVPAQERDATIEPGVPCELDAPLGDRQTKVVVPATVGQAGAPEVSDG